MTETIEQKCGEPALYYISWASKQVPCCQRHANGIQAVANAIGAPAEAIVNNDPSVLCTFVDKD